MSTQPRNDDASDLQEAAEEEEVLKLKEEVEQMAQKILEYRTTLPVRLSSTLSSRLASQGAVLPIHFSDEWPDPEAGTLPSPVSEAGVRIDRTKENMALLVAEDKQEAEKIQLLKQKISSNTDALPVVLNRMKEYMARIDKLESSDVIIHPAFKKRRASPCV